MCLMWALCELWDYSSCVVVAVALTCLFACCFFVLVIVLVCLLICCLCLLLILVGVSSLL